MKTTLNIDDALLRRAKRRAAELGVTLTSLVEDGLRVALIKPKSNKPYRLRFPVTRGDYHVDVADRRAMYAVLEEDDG